MSKKSDIEKEIKEQRKFSFNDALSEKAKGVFKDASVIPPLKEAEIFIEKKIKADLYDSAGALHQALIRRVKNSSALSENLNNPADALKIITERILSKDARLYEFVREVDQKYGEIYGERPLFQLPGGKAHPDDEYTHSSVKKALEDLLQKLR